MTLINVLDTEFLEVEESLDIFEVTVYIQDEIEFEVFANDKCVRAYKLAELEL